MDVTCKIVEISEDVVQSYIDTSKPQKFKCFAAQMLQAVKSYDANMLSEFPDQVVCGLFPHVQLTDNGREYFARCKKLPSSWAELTNSGLFFIDGKEREFIMLLVKQNEKIAIRILCAIGIMRKNLNAIWQEQ